MIEYYPVLPEVCSQTCCKAAQVTASYLISFEKMKYIMSWTFVFQESGPTNVGDEFSDPAVMSYLGARKTTMLGNNLWVVQMRTLMVLCDMLQLKLGLNYP